MLKVYQGFKFEEIAEVLEHSRIDDQVPSLHCHGIVEGKPGSAAEQHMKNPDLNAYVLGELTEAERKEAEQFIASDPEAGLEVERLRLVTACMRSVAEEEPPRRIAFVSDKVFEPSWFARLWNSSAKLGFVSAAMLACAILAHGWISRPVVSAPR